MGKKRQPYLKENLPPGSVEQARWNALLHPQLSHGGPASKGKRKTRRPYFSNAPQFFVLSSDRARGDWDLLRRRNHSRIRSQIYVYAKRFRVRVFAARVKKGRIELLVRAGDRKDLADYFRVLAGRAAVAVTGAKKRVKRVGKFWNELCFSKLLNWGAEFHHFRDQIVQKSNVSAEEPVDGLFPHPNPKPAGS